MQVFKYVLQYLRAKRDSKVFSLPASLSPDTAAAVADEAVFLGLPELKTASMRCTGEYEYLFTCHNTNDHYSNQVNLSRKWTDLSADKRFPHDVQSQPVLARPGWELVSIHWETRYAFLTWRRLKPLCNE